MHFVRDIAFGGGMMFAKQTRWKIEGEYNITVSETNNITFCGTKNITLSESEAYH